MPKQHGAAGWSLAEVRDVLAAYGRRPRDLVVAEMAHGWENLNLRLEADGESLVLRRYDVTAPEEVAWELELLRFLSGVGFPTAPLIRRTDGGLASTLGGRPAALFGFVAGVHPEWGAPAAAEQAAAAVAQLHQVTAGLTLPFPRTRMDNRGRMSRFLAWVQERGIGPTETRLATLAEQVEGYAAAFATRLAPYERVLPQGVVHHDAHANNVLVDEQGRLVALLDFDDAHETFLLADVAVLVETWSMPGDTHRFEPDRAVHVLRAYERGRPLGDAERELLPDFLALYNVADATSYVQGRIEAGTPASQAVDDCDQYARFCARTAAPDWRERLRDELAWS